MTKNWIRTYSTLTVVLIVFSVIAFVAPFTRTSVFWMAYIFGFIAIVFQIYVLRTSFSKGEGIKSKFYGFPIARVGAIYLAIQLIVSLVEMIAATYLQTWVVVIINVLPITYAIIGCIAADAMRDEIERQDIKLKKDVSNMRALQSLVSILLSLSVDEETEKMIINLADELKYSDPVSTETTKIIEEELSQQMNEMQKALVDGDIVSVKSLCIRTILNLNERNRMCALNK